MLPAAHVEATALAVAEAAAAAAAGRASGRSHAPFAGVGLSGGGDELSAAALVAATFNGTCGPFPLSLAMTTSIMARGNRGGDAGGGGVPVMPRRVLYNRVRKCGSTTMKRVITQLSIRNKFKAIDLTLPEHLSRENQDTVVGLFRAEASSSARERASERTTTAAHPRREISDTPPPRPTATATARSRENTIATNVRRRSLRACARA